MLTCYGFSFAQILNQTAIDMVLVGDSGTMTQLGYPDTTYANRVLSKPQLVNSKL